MRAKVMGRVPNRALYLRVRDGMAHKIIRVPDDVLPHGMKTVTDLEVELLSPITHDGCCYTALVSVVGSVDAEGSKELSQGH